MSNNAILKTEYVSCMFENTFDMSLFDKAMSIKAAIFPKYLYRYRPINDFTFSEIEKSEVFMAFPSRFNDIFDSVPVVDVSRVVNPQMEGYLELAKQELRNQGFSEAKIKDLDQLATPFYDDFNSLVREMSKSKIKIACFTEHPNNILMWAHYTTNNSGICIEYDFSKLDLENEIKFNTHPVIYVNSRKDFTDHFLGKDKHSFPLLEQALYKNIKWEYEDEWRLIDDNQKIGEHCKNISISGIYLGTSITAQNEKAVCEIANVKSIPVYKGKLSNRNYEIVFERINADRE